LCLFRNVKVRILSHCFFSIIHNCRYNKLLEDLSDPNGAWKLSKVQWEKIGVGFAKSVENEGEDIETAFLFLKDNSGQQLNDITLRQDIPIVEGELYQFCFFAKMEQTVGNLLRFSIIKIKNWQSVGVTYWGNDTLEMSRFSQWNSHNGQFQVPEGTNTYTVRMIFYRGQGRGSCLIDNVSLQRQEKQTYYVSSSDGNDENDGLSPDKPWSSLQKVSNNKFLSGDSILFKTGDEFIGQLDVSSSGTPEVPIVFTSYGSGNKPIINGSGAAGGDYEFAVLIENKKGIVLDNIEVQNDRHISRPDNKDIRSYGILIRVNEPESMESFILKNLTIKNIYPIHLDDVSFYDVEVAGIHVYTTVNYEGKEKHISDVLIENCDISRSAKLGIWTVHGFSVTDEVGNDTINRNQNIVIKNNYIYENGGSGISISKAYNCLIEHNLIEYLGTSSFDSRMVGRGGSIWFFNSHNAVSYINLCGWRARFI
jgi:hypothetical protein